MEAIGVASGCGCKVSNILVYTTAHDLHQVGYMYFKWYDNSPI